MLPDINNDHKVSPWEGVVASRMIEDARRGDENRPLGGSGCSCGTGCCFVIGVLVGLFLMALFFTSCGA